MSADELIQQLKKANFRITSPGTIDTRALESNRYIRQYRILKANNILVLILEFEDEKIAATYRNKLDLFFDPNVKAPSSMQSRSADTRIIQHNNLVVRLVNQIDDQITSKEADEIVKIIQDL